MEIYGEIGILADDGEKVQCHLCGKWFSALNQHVMKKHRVDCDDYRQMFGLNKRQPLAGKLFQETQRRAGAERLISYFSKDELARRMKAQSEKNRGKKLEIRPQRRKSLSAQIPQEKIEQMKELGKKGELPFLSGKSRAKSTAAHQTPRYKEKARERVLSGINPLLRPDIVEIRKNACRTPESRAKRGAAHKGKIVSEESRKKMSEAQKRIPREKDEKGRFKPKGSN